jgi:hypothetical protein
MKLPQSTRRAFLAAGGLSAAGAALAQSSFGKDIDNGPGVPPRLLARVLLNGCTSDPEHERVLIRYTRGQGQLSQDRQYIHLQMNMYSLDGRPDGWHAGVWHAKFSSVLELLAVPSKPQNPLVNPEPPVPEDNPLAYTVAHWTFHDGSRLYAEGPALSHLVLLDSSPTPPANFSVACSQILSEGGTGFFANAHGLKQSLGATAVPPGVNFFDLSQPAPSFVATTIDTFRIVWPGGVPRGFDREFND